MRRSCAGAPDHLPAYRARFQHRRGLEEAKFLSMTVEGLPEPPEVVGGSVAGLGWVNKAVCVWFQLKTLAGGGGCRYCALDGFP